VDLAEVKATFYLPNAEIGAARPGGKATVVADAFPDRKFEGTIASVSARAEFTPRNIQTRSDRDRLVYPVEVRVANPEGLLRPGMPVQVTLPRGN
jgi:HlyD family secretion protein